MNLTTATPAEIDTLLADLYGKAAAAEARVAAAVEGLHAGERKTWYGRRQVWPTTHQAAEDAARAAAARGETMGLTYSNRPWQVQVDRVDAARAALDAILREMDAPNAEFTRRGGWSRFYVVQANGGHVHSSMRCSTCNNGRTPTEFGWTPELSGKTEAEAVAELGPMLCTVCYPSAPVAWTVGKPAPERCAGSGKAAKPGTRRGKYAQCTGCDEFQYVTTSGAVRAHKPAKGE